MISTSAIQLFSKPTTTNEIFIETPHFFLKLVQKLRNNKSSSFGGPILTGQKDKFMSNESPAQTFWLVPNVTNVQKRIPKYLQPWSRDSEIISS